MKIDYNELLSFYKGKRVFITGHTGFKGSYLTRILLNAGANVMGYSLEPPTTPSIFDLSGLERNNGLSHIIGDVRTLPSLKEAFASFRPEIVFHLAAQPIVRESYRDPVGTYEVNVMGTVNILECVRTISGVRSFLNVTTDKVYQNREWEWGYRETDVLDGYDPYSNSKSCSELVTHSYRNSFFSVSGADSASSGTDSTASSLASSPGRIPQISTARAGNVIGGGDFASDRIIPDCVRALANETQAVVTVRNPYSIRPYQHVLEPLFAYLLIAKKQYEDGRFSGNYNVGPDEEDCVPTGKLVSIFCDTWNIGKSSQGKEGSPSASGIIIKPDFSAATGLSSDLSLPMPGSASASPRFHEAGLLKLDCSRMKTVFGWKPVWHIRRAIEETVSFVRVYLSGADENGIQSEMDREITAYINDANR